VVNVAAPPSDLALVAAGAEWRGRNGWSVLAKFEGELANRSETYIGTARVKYAWRLPTCARRSRCRQSRFFSPTFFAAQEAGFGTSPRYWPG
jgi:hypothetical protein